MTLPSQNARPLSRRTATFRRARTGRLSKLMIGAGALGAALLVAWAFWPDGGGETGERGDEASHRRLDPARESGRGSEPAPSAALATPTVHLTAPEAPPALAPSTERGEANRIQAPADAGGASRPTSSDAQRRAVREIDVGLDLLSRNQPIEGRRVLSAALLSRDLAPEEAQRARDALTDLSDRLVFSPELVEGDPFSFAYVVQEKDYLSTLPRKLGVVADWHFIQHLNRIPKPESMRLGQRLKIVTGPFHAVITKSAYRMDVWMGDERQRVYVRSFPVGLGEHNSTPEGRFRVRPNSKLENPEWINPRTRQRYAADDPANPIGDHWLGLVGAEPHLASVEGYGIHGTIEPDSIGRQVSMGCVRMLPADVALVWSMLMEDVSTVEIVP